MIERLPTVLAGAAIAAVGTALWAMATGRLTIAGLCFLSASLLIYLRERWLQRRA